VLETFGLQFFAGAVALGFVVVGLFFIRFWQKTGDGLFMLFGLAFGLLALNQVLVALSGIPRDEQSLIYLIRLAAFVLIIVAIVRKNIGRRS